MNVIQLFNGGTEVPSLNRSRIYVNGRISLLLCCQSHARMPKYRQGVQRVAFLRSMNLSTKFQSRVIRFPVVNIERILISLNRLNGESTCGQV